MQMTGNTILITGGGSGIGRGLAEAFHALGNRVIVAGRRAAMLQEVVAAHPGMAAVVLDVADGAAMAPFAAQMAADYPALNVVIHNAGIMRAEDMRAEPYDLADAEATIATNLLGPIRLTSVLLPQLRRQERAALVTVSSGLAFVPLAMTPTYSATKAAIHSWSQSLRHQLASTAIEVIEIAPPAVATDLMARGRSNPMAQPLDDFIAETMALLAQGGPEILVERVKRLRHAEAQGSYDAVFAALNPAA